MLPPETGSGTRGSAYVHLEGDRALEAWRHFASTGASDKHTMVTIVSWLLGFVAGEIGYVVTKLVTATMSPIAKERMLVVSLLGFLISFVAAFLSLLYGGYSHRNWAHADYIAEKNGWRELLPPERMNAESVTPESRGSIGWALSKLTQIGWYLSTPTTDETRLAPVFYVYFALAALAGLGNAGFLAWSGFSRYGWSFVIVAVVIATIAFFAARRFARGDTTPAAARMDTARPQRDAGQLDRID